MRMSSVKPVDRGSSPVAREFALAQASMQHAIYFIELGANERAADYFNFAAQRLQGLAVQLTALESEKVS